MNVYKITRASHVIVTCVLLTVLLAFSVTATAVSLPPRFYHKTLIGTNFTPILGLSMDGNVNPLDPSYTINSDANINANIVFAGYARNFVLFGRSAQFAYLQPMGDISIRSTYGSANPIDSSANGFGDPFFEFNINLFGPGPQYNLPDALRYNPGFSVDFLADLSVPLGEYNKGEAINMGMNRFWGRIGLPMIYQIGDVWGPGHRTSLEIIPAVILYGDNDDYGPTGNLTQSTDPGFSIAAHLTHDLSDNIWASLDYTYLQLGDSEVGPIETDGENFSSVGATIGTQLTRNVVLDLGYQTTINDSDPGDIRMSTFSFSLTFFWAPLLDGLHRIGSDME
ncbi:transporter [Desulfoluna spongiiphila]|uniref:Putative MetA-pathway of phenol degradation n=1 Tax=Desulfoluna spongiiphila TaxID=419481 RepID=A0A1G5IMQ4_9BACT|nr:transporter [Desulfoluna spongiiphila]SCY76859.1 Putative MetA-pathway of phenol degradation [Desulfoluna spongiiphila]